MTFDLTCDVISDIQITFCRIFGKVILRAINCRFRIEHWSISFVNIAGGVGGGGEMTSLDVQGPEIPHRGAGQENKICVSWIRRGSHFADLSFQHQILPTEQGYNVAYPD